MAAFKLIYNGELGGNVATMPEALRDGVKSYAKEQGSIL